MVLRSKIVGVTATAAGGGEAFLLNERSAHFDAG
jgi:hypothetical protein